MNDWIATLLFIGVGVGILHFVGLWMDSKGWIYYKTKPKGGGAGNALQEMQVFLNPSARHVQVAKEDKKSEAGKSDD